MLTVASRDRIILLGSAAADQMTGDSDTDLLVLESGPIGDVEESVRIRAAIGRIGYPCDVVVLDTPYFEHTKHVVGGIAFPANKYGRVVYGAG